MNQRTLIALLTALLLTTCVACVRLTNEPPRTPGRGTVAEVGIQAYLQEASWDTNSVFEFPEPVGFTMPNGLKVLLVQRAEIPMVYVRAQIRGGSIYDPVDKLGLASLTGWTLTEGTARYPGSTIDAVMDRHGAQVTSVAYNESCLATLTCLAKDTETLFPYFAEILADPSFTEESLEEARSYLIGDILRSMDDLSELGYRRFRHDLFGTQAYAKPQQGTIDGLRACTRADVKAFYTRFYRPNHAVLVFVGAISMEQVRALCENHLSAWSATDEALPPIDRPTQASGVRFMILDRDTVQAQIMAGNIGIDRVNPDRFAVEVMNHILGGSGLFSRLATEVRVNRGLTYSIGSFFAQREFTGEFAISTFTKLESVGETVNVILAELNKIRTAPVTEQELKDAKQGLIGRFPLQFERYEGIASTLVHLNFYGLPMDDITRYPQSISKITKEEVLKAAQEYIKPADLIFTIVGPASSIVHQLHTLGQITVVEAI